MKATDQILEGLVNSVVAKCNNQLRLFSICSRQGIKKSNCNMLKNKINMVFLADILEVEKVLINGEVVKVTKELRRLLLTHDARQ